MKEMRLYLGIVLAMLGLAGQATAQDPPAMAARQEALLQLSEQLQQRDALDREQVITYARRLGIAVRRELPHARVLELQRLLPGRGPVFYITNNVDAADTVATDELGPGGTAGLDLDGSGVTVAEWDGGAIYAAHPDLAGGVNQMDDSSLFSGLSTHVAGTSNCASATATF